MWLYVPQCDLGRRDIVCLTWSVVPVDDEHGVMVLIMVVVVVAVVWGANIAQLTNLYTVFVLEQIPPRQRRIRLHHNAARAQRRSVVVVAAAAVVVLMVVVKVNELTCEPGESGKSVTSGRRCRGRCCPLRVGLNTASGSPSAPCLPC